VYFLVKLNGENKDSLYLPNTLSGALQPATIIFFIVPMIFKMGFAVS